MYIIREVVQCKPGKVKPFLDKFRTISTLMQDMGHAPCVF